MKKKISTTNNLEKAHYFHPYLQQPLHPITVNVIGAGGTGSVVMKELARINASLLALDHKGIYVRCFDPDIVTYANLGRQLYSESDVNMSKATCIVSRINNFFGFNWQAYPISWPSDPSTWIAEFEEKENIAANITLTCVDSTVSRFLIHEFLKEVVPEIKNIMYKPLYQIDFGNDKNMGQVILSTAQKINQPRTEIHETVHSLPGFIERYNITRKLLKKDMTSLHSQGINGQLSSGSCSLAEALYKQDLFINTTVANYGCHLLWKMFRSIYTTSHGVCVNLDPVDISEIPIK